MFLSKEKGFTLIEIILVIAVIGVLAAVVFVAVDPARRFGEAQNSLRDKNCDELEKCLTTLVADNNGTVPAAIAALTLNTPYMLVSAGGSTAGNATCTTLGQDIARVDLASLMEPYIGELPIDPDATGDDTGYYITRVSDAGFVVEHCYEYTASAGEEGGGGFACGDTVSYEGVNYATVQIGTQCWFAQNLNVGTRVAGGTGGYSCVSAAAIKKYCYNDSEANCTADGGIYIWPQAMCGSEVNGAQGICPTGWHIPTHDEFTTLERAVCTSGSCTTDFPIDTTTTGWRGTNEGTKLKAGGSSGFNDVLGGIWDNYEYMFLYQDGTGWIWSSTKYGLSSAWYRTFSSALATVGRYRGAISGDFYAGSVRCIQD